MVETSAISPPIHAELKTPRESFTRITSRPVAAAYPKYREIPMMKRKL